ncbi:MAG: SpoIIE family protein phosphatase [Bacteroidales bacterium]|nr:SpoIIE family protein phosphatase [Bacteroidales bacterium]
MRYAETIQQAILPDFNLNKNKLFETFVIYRPKDIVSGDFYWYAKHTNENNNEVHFFAVVDCTGHGVPGAFMSMIGNRLLNEIVNERRITVPSQVLELLNNEVRNALRQEQTDNNDGMDLCMCKIEKRNGQTKAVYSGAKRPLYILKSSSQKLERLKGDRKSIGGISNKNLDIPFTDTETELSKGDLIYMFSDGITDQNGPDRKRYGSKRLEKQIESFIDTNLKEQKELLEKDLDGFVQDEEQRDDISMIGIRIL